MQTQREGVFYFGEVEVREREFCILRSGEVIPVEPKAFKVLLYLLRRPNILIRKDELLDAVWDDSNVSENSLTRSIAVLRRVLGDDPRDPQYIATVPTVGYRFLARVSEGAIPSPVELGEMPARSHTQSLEGPAGAKGTPSEPPAVHHLVADAAGGRVENAFLRMPSTPLLFVLIVILVIAAAWILTRRTSRLNVMEPPNLHLTTEQRLTFNPPEAPVRGAVLSPDGKYVAYADPTGLYLHLISSGENRPLVLPEGFVAWPNSWYPDGTHILVVRTEDQYEAPGLTGGNFTYRFFWKLSLWKISVIGGPPQKIRDNAAGGSVSPDGSHIAYLPGPGFGNELWTMDSDGTDPQRVISDGDFDQAGRSGSWIFPIVWSPSGQQLAYIRRRAFGMGISEEPAALLETADTDGKRAPRIILSDPRLGTALCWSAAGRILFSYRGDSANKRRNFGVYSVSLDERTGRGPGPLKAVTAAEGEIGGLSSSLDGRRVALWRKTDQPQAFILNFEAGSHRMDSPHRLTLDVNGNIASAWTPDSKAVLFVSNRNGNWKLFRQNIDENAAELLVEGADVFLPRLSADGLHVLYLAAVGPNNVAAPKRLMSKPLAGGPPEVLLEDKGILNYQCATAPSQTCILSKLEGFDLVFHTFSEHGIGREVFRRAGGYVDWNLSPDGAEIALFVEKHLIRFLSVNTGSVRDITPGDWPLLGGDWSVDGKGLFVPSVTPRGIPVILNIDLSGKVSVVWEGQANATFSWLIQSPDGRHGILEAPTSGDHNIWMVEDF